MLVVSDTTPITTLLAIQRCELLQQLYSEIIISETVRDELLRHHPDLPSFLKVKAVRDRRALKKFAKDVHPGEAEAIVLAVECGADLLLIDDLAGRRAAKKQGLEITGLVGVIANAKAESLIPSVREVFEQIERKTRFYMTESLMEKALRIANEN